MFEFDLKKFLKLKFTWMSKLTKNKKFQSPNSNSIVNVTEIQKKNFKVQSLITW